LEGGLSAEVRRKPSFEMQMEQPAWFSLTFYLKNEQTDPALRDCYEISGGNKKPLPVFPEGA
jgi:hypothetical protein